MSAPVSSRSAAASDGKRSRLARRSARRAPSSAPLAADSTPAAADDDSPPSAPRSANVTGPNSVEVTSAGDIVVVYNRSSAKLDLQIRFSAYLHDGSAASLDDAVTVMLGAVATLNQGPATLSTADRQALVEFLRGL